MHRRDFIATSLGLLTVSLLSGTALSQDKTKVTWWYDSATPENKEYLQKFLVDAFNAAHPESELQLDYRGSALDKQLRVALLSGQGPDVVATPGPSYVAPMANGGQLLALDGYAESLGWTQRLLPAFLDMGRYNGKLYALPKTYETLGLFYNKTMFAENGWAVPKTIGELDTLAAAMAAKGIIPFGAGNADWRGTNEWYVSIVLNSVAGPDAMAQVLRGEIPWTSEPIVKAIETLNGWWQKGYFGPDYFSLTTEQGFAQIATGKAGLCPTGTWSFGMLSTYFPNNVPEPGFVGFPSAEGLPYPIYALGIGSTFSIAASSKMPDAAAAAIDLVFTPDFYEKMNSVWLGEWNAPLRDLSGIQLADTVPAIYTEAMANLASSVDANQYGYTTWTFMPPASNTYVISGIEEVWLGQITVQQYLEQLDATFKQELAEGLVPAVPARA